MPNGRPHDHPLTDITVHKISTYSRRADSLVRKIHKAVSPMLWDFLYLLVREGKMIRAEGSNKQIPIREFEDMLADLLDSAETLADKFKTAKQEIMKK